MQGISSNISPYLDLIPVWKESSLYGELKSSILSLLIPIQLSTLPAIIRKRRVSSPNPAENHSAL